MKNVLLLLHICIELISCADNHSAAVDNRMDSLSVSIESTDQSVDSSIDQDTIGFAEEKASSLSEYEQSLAHPYVFDEEFVLGNDTLIAHVERYSIEDSGVTIPAKLVSTAGSKNYVTDNCVTSIRLQKNGQLLLDTIIYKNDFKPYLNKEMRRYGILFWPKAFAEGNKIHFAFKVGVPATNIGQEVGLIVTKEGKVKTTGQPYKK